MLYKTQTTLLLTRRSQSPVKMADKLFFFFLFFFWKAEKWHFDYEMKNMHTHEKTKELHR